LASATWAWLQPAADTGEEQVGVGRPARRERLPLPAPGKLYEQKSEVMLLHDSSITPGRVSAPQAIRVIF
jgi:hypothetical protein